MEGNSPKSMAKCPGSSNKRFTDMNHERQRLTGFRFRFQIIPKLPFRIRKQRSLPLCWWSLEFWKRSTRCSSMTFLAEHAVGTPIELVRWNFNLQEIGKIDRKQIGIRASSEGFWQFPPRFLWIVGPFRQVVAEVHGNQTSHERAFWPLRAQECRRLFEPCCRGRISFVLFSCCLSGK